MRILLRVSAQFLRITGGQGRNKVRDRVELSEVSGAANMRGTALVLQLNSAVGAEHNNASFIACSALLP
jgi:hypothetical protein